LVPNHTGQVLVSRGFDGRGIVVVDSKKVWFGQRRPFGL
jgi:hypothetical protein